MSANSALTDEAKPGTSTQNSTPGSSTENQTCTPESQCQCPEANKPPRWNFLIMNVDPHVTGKSTGEVWVSDIRPYINTLFEKPDFVLYQEDIHYKRKDFKVFKSERIKDILIEKFAGPGYTNCHTIEGIEGTNKFNGILYQRMETQILNPANIRLPENTDESVKDRFQMVTCELGSKTYLIVSFHGKRKGAVLLEEFNLNLKIFQGVINDRKLDGIIIGGDFNIDINKLKKELQKPEFQNLNLEVVVYKPHDMIDEGDSTIRFVEMPLSQFQSLRVTKLDPIKIKVKSKKKKNNKDTIIFSNCFKLREFGMMRLPEEIMAHPILQVTLELLVEQNPPVSSDQPNDNTNDNTDHNTDSDEEENPNENLLKTMNDTLNKIFEIVSNNQNNPNSSSVVADDNPIPEMENLTVKNIEGD